MWDFGNDGRGIAKTRQKTFKSEEAERDGDRIVGTQNLYGLEGGRWGMT